MGERAYPRRVENYTNAFLVTSGIILFMAFFTIAAISGTAAVLVTALLVHYSIRALPRLRRSRARA